MEIIGDVVASHEAIPRSRGLPVPHAVSIVLKVGRGVGGLANVEPLVSYGPVIVSIMPHGHVRHLRIALSIAPFVRRPISGIILASVVDVHIVVVAS